MLYKIAKIAAILLLLITCSCRGLSSLGITQPASLELEVPDGPPEFKAGWHAGCRTALSTGVYAGAWVYQGHNGPDMGSGVYQHDPIFQSAFGQGMFACENYTATFMDTRFRELRGPLE